MVAAHLLRDGHGVAEGAPVAQVAAHRVAQAPGHLPVRHRRGRDAEERHDVLQHALADELVTDGRADGVGLHALDVTHELAAGIVLVAGAGVGVERQAVELPEVAGVVGIEARAEDRGQVAGHVEVDQDPRQHLGSDPDGSGRYRDQQADRPRALGGDDGGPGRDHARGHAGGRGLDARRADDPQRALALGAGARRGRAVCVTIMKICRNNPGEPGGTHRSRPLPDGGDHVAEVGRRHVEGGLRTHGRHVSP